jgi:hypothetical protein
MVQLRPNLTLVTYGMEQAARGFEHYFQETWGRLPIKSREVLDAYWAQRPGTVYLCYKMDYGDYPQEPYGKFTWYEDRTLFTFLAPVILRADSDEGPVHVIAHELAHCYHKATGTWTPDHQREEINAQRTTAEWGFPELAFDRAGWNHGVEEWRSEHEVDKGHLTETAQMRRGGFLASRSVCAQATDDTDSPAFQSARWRASVGLFRGRSAPVGGRKPPRRAKFGEFARR